MDLVPAISGVEEALRRGDFGAASAGCLKILSALESHPAALGDRRGKRAARQLATRIATAILSLLTAPRFTPTPPQVRRFIVYKRPLSHVFEASRYRGTGVLAMLLKRLGVKDASLLRRLVMGLSINAMDEQLVARLRSLPPRMALVAVLGALCENFIWSPRAERIRSALLGLDWLPRDVRLDPMEMQLMASAWMACSYADAPYKHQVKDTLNALVRADLKHRGITVPAPRRDLKARPTVLVIGEICYQGHAMDRCYRPAIRSLRRHFRTVLLMAAGHYDPPVPGLFDGVDGTIFSDRRPEELVARAASYRPDIVYFPSVGMRIGAIRCANLRLAPIQIATNGHPATSRSDCVDYMVLVDEVVGDPACFSETLLLRPPGRHYVRHSEPVSVAPEVRRRPETVRLAVPAWIRKVTPGFLETCREIAARAKRPVEFRFFPNVRGVQFHSVRRRIESLLPARVFPTTSYREYIENLNACDIHLSTFPFGSSNGIVDSVCQGLPVVNLVGVEPHARLDASLVKRVGQPEWLTAKTREEYVDAALRLVHDDSLRVEISEAILAARPAEQYFVAGDEETPEFADMFLAVYRHHEAMQSDGRKVWTAAQLRELLRGNAA